jgi:hypothetical protein
MTDLPAPTTADIRTMRGAARKVAVAQRKAAVARLLDRGRTLREAATELGLTFGQVASVSRALIRDSEETYREHRDRINARLLRQNHVLQRVCWEHLERAMLGHIRQEVEEDGAPPAAQENAQVASQATRGKSRTRTMRENDLMAEARILETLRKTQADEAKILGWKPPEEDSTPDVSVDQRTLVIINNAGLPGTIGWLDTIEPGFARQGVGLLPPGSPDPLEAELTVRADEGVETPTSSAEQQPGVRNADVSAENGQPSIPSTPRGQGETVDTNGD